MICILKIKEDDCEKTLGAQLKVIVSFGVPLGFDPSD
jgi:hypothetical protein